MNNNQQQQQQQQLNQMINLTQQTASTQGLNNRLQTPRGLLLTGSQNVLMPPPSLNQLLAKPPNLNQQNGLTSPLIRPPTQLNTQLQSINQLQKPPINIQTSVPQLAATQLSTNQQKPLISNLNGTMQPINQQQQQQAIIPNINNKQTITPPLLTSQFQQPSQQQLNYSNLTQLPPPPPPPSLTQQNNLNGPILNKPLNSNIVPPPVQHHQQQTSLSNQSPQIYPQQLMNTNFQQQQQKQQQQEQLNESTSTSENTEQSLDNSINTQSSNESNNQQYPSQYIQQPQQQRTYTNPLQQQQQHQHSQPTYYPQQTQQYPLHTYQQYPQQQQQQQQPIFNSNINNGYQSNNIQQQQLQQQQQTQLNSTMNQFNRMTLNKGNQKPLALDLLNEKRLITTYEDEQEIIRPKFPHDFYTNVNCSPDIIRCTLTSIPESQTLLNKIRLPLGILIHPFKDLESLKVVQSTTIVRCRNCRSYINPFVHFMDNTKWRCNLCYTVNDLPEEFLYDPVTRSYGDPTKRPEINTSTIEFIAPAEYTLRPPPAATYLFLLDVSRNAINTGYLKQTCDLLIECLDKIPGDTRTKIGFITYSNTLHFYNLLTQQLLVYTDIDDAQTPQDIQLPLLPENLMCNLNENKDLIEQFLKNLPQIHLNSCETESCLGSALNAAFKLISTSGGRITIMQTCLPNLGVGSLKPRNDSLLNGDKGDSQVLNAQNDFYKKYALECANVHIACDLFMFNSLYSDLASLSCISKYSSGEIKYYPDYHHINTLELVEKFQFDFKRYLTRKIGFEAVMRMRCTRGLSIHTFHGNFFVRSTDLLALPNVNPDAAYGLQISIDEQLQDVSTICFQSALLYTSSKGERRIRIHTYCLPVSSNPQELIQSADQECIVGLVAKMAVDRTLMNSLKEAKDALVNVASDYLKSYSQLMTSINNNGRSSSSSLLTSYSLRLIPLYMMALIKSFAFKNGHFKLDDRTYALCQYKSLPLKFLLLIIYPNLYAIHNLDDTKTLIDSDIQICIPPRLHLTSESIDRHGVYLLDCGESIIMWIGRSVNDLFLKQVFNCNSFNELPDHSTELPELDNELSERIRCFIIYLYDQRPFGVSFLFMREDSVKRHLFLQYLIEDKTESSLSYNEFLRYLNEQMKS